MISNPRRGRAPVSPLPRGFDAPRTIAGEQRPAHSGHSPRGRRIRPAWRRALGQPPSRSSAHVHERRLQIALVEAVLDGANERVEAVLADRQRGRPRLSADDQGLLLLAYSLNGRGAEAEERARRLVIETRSLAPGHLQGVLDAWTYRGCPEGVERAYREFAPFLRVRDRAEARVGFLRALGLAGDPARARRWYAIFADPSAESFAALVAAHGHPGQLVRLHRLWIGARSWWLWDQEVAEAFVHSFALAGDPEAAERRLGDALALVEDLDVRDAMCLAVAGSYLRAGRGADARRVMEMGEPSLVVTVEGGLA